MLGYLSADIICSEKRTVFRERSSRKTVSYEEQIMSKDKYPGIFSPQMEAIEGFARQPRCMAGTMKIFCIRKKKFHRRKNLLFLSSKTSIVFIIRQISLATRAAWKIGEYSVT